MRGRTQGSGLGVHVLLILAVIVAWPAMTLPAGAQDHAGHERDAERAQPDDGAWRWHTDASVFFGVNHQERKFRDFTVWESQNWMMAAGERAVGRARLRLHGMWSLEAFTLKDIGSPQVFQTGETYQGGALIDYQHPHDLIMGAGAGLRVPAGRATVVVNLDLVGSPALGPPVFMHRPSAALNPQAPLGHHHLDATHITPGVISGGVEAGEWTLQGSWFRGREPDEDRLDLDLGPLDSYSVRLSWARAAWAAQASAGWLDEPELVTPYDAKKLTASLSYTRDRLAWMAAFGQKREIHGNLEAYLIEATWHARPRDAFYTRLESVAKDILDVGFHPVGTFHRHRQSQVSAATIGYLREMVRTAAGALGVGGDITAYLVPSNLKEAYGAPLSFHAFVRYRLRPLAGHVH